jgi:hypothetical protein
VAVEYSNLGAAVASFAAKLCLVRQGVDKLASYKGLHDQIHTLQFAYFGVVENTVNRPSIDDSDLRSLAHYEVQIRQLADDSYRIARRAAFGGAEIDWIAELQRACDDLRAGANSADAKRLRLAVRHMDRILATRPELINRGLIDAARALPLEPLEAALVELERCLSLSGDSRVSARVSDIEASRVALTAVGGQLASLIDEHDAWQAVDVELRRLGGALEWAPTEFAFSWPLLKVGVEQLCDGSDADWSRVLSAAAESIEAATTQLPQLKQAFAVYRHEAERRFYQVDFTLTAVCDQLECLDKPLARLADVMAGQAGWGA